MLAKVKRSLAAAVVLMLALPAVQAADYRAGEQYTRLDKPVAAAPAVVEFFLLLRPLLSVRRNLPRRQYRSSGAARR